MPYQALHKRRPSDCLPAIRLHAGHPPLTSLRSFAPPYAPRRGLVVCLHSRDTLSFRAHHCNSERARCHSERSEEPSPLRKA